jgi:hypothetical protein
MLPFAAVTGLGAGAFLARPSTGWALAGLLCVIVGGTALLVAMLMGWFNEAALHLLRNGGALASWTVEPSDWNAVWRRERTMLLRRLAPLQVTSAILVALAAAVVWFTGVRTDDLGIHITAGAVALLLLSAAGGVRWLTRMRRRPADVLLGLSFAWVGHRFIRFAAPMQLPTEIQLDPAANTIVIISRSSADAVLRFVIPFSPHALPQVIDAVVTLRRVWLDER